jgi:hypothetical protein
MTYPLVQTWEQVTVFFDASAPSHWLFFFPPLCALCTISAITAICALCSRFVRFPHFLHFLHLAANLFTWNPTTRYLRQPAEHSGIGVPSGAQLRKLYMRAVAMVLSRAHEGVSLTPLVDLVNGMPSGSPNMNVGFCRGYWPFLKGSTYRNDCDLVCPALSASRKIKAGEQIIVSYGDLSTGGFVLKYGVVPDRTLGVGHCHCGKHDQGFLRPPPQLLPAENTL